MGSMKNEEVRARFTAFWSDYVTALNPDARRPPDIRNPASLTRYNVKNTADQFAAFVNRFQIHMQCAPGYCLRENKVTKEHSCRFYFRGRYRKKPRLLERSTIRAGDSLLFVALHL